MHTAHQIDAWATWARAGGRSATTISLYRHYVTELAGTVDPLTASPDDLAAWLARPSWAPETRKSARTAARSFYRWAVLTGRRDSDPTAVLPAVRVPAGTPRPIPRGTFAAALLDAPPRTRLMLELARFAGLRRAEIARVHTRDVEDDVLRVHGKGGRVRVVPLHPVLLGQVRSAPAGWLFGSPGGGHLTAGAVGKLMTAALPDGWTPHTLRHRAGTDWYAVGRDLLAVQALLGHSRADTTRRYVALPDGALRAAVYGVAS